MKDSWIIVCGDGHKHSSEEWDDLNTSPTDGWSSSCTIETGFVCSGGAASTPDTWMEWPEGTETNSDKSQCQNIWGNSIRNDGEKCDDGNSQDNDGWSSTCTVENNYVWLGGSTTTKDNCTECGRHLEPNEEGTEWVAESFSETEANTYSGSIGGVGAVTVFMNLIYSAQSGVSAENIPGGIYFIQLILLIPEIGSSIPTLIHQTIYNMKIFFLSFDFIPDAWFPFLSSLDSSLSKLRDLNESDENFKILRSRSSIVNLFKLLIVSLVIFPLINWLLLFLGKILSKRKKPWLKKTGDKILSIVDRNFYLRYLMLIYIFLMISAFTEIQVWMDKGNGEIISRIFALFIAIFWCGIILSAGVYWIKYSSKVTIQDDNGEDSKTKTMVWFLGVKKSKFSRLHIFLFFLKRFFFCFLIYILKDLDALLKIIMFLPLQLIFWAIAVLLRSPSTTKELILEILNEFIYLILLACLLIHEITDGKLKVGMYLFISLIMFNYI